MKTGSNIFAHLYILPTPMVYSRLSAEFKRNNSVESSVFLWSSCDNRKYKVCVCCVLNPILPCSRVRDYVKSISAVRCDELASCVSQSSEGKASFKTVNFCVLRLSLVKITFADLVSMEGGTLLETKLCGKGANIERLNVVLFAPLKTLDILTEEEVANFMDNIRKGVNC